MLAIFLYWQGVMRKEFVLEVFERDILIVLNMLKYNIKYI